MARRLSLTTAGSDMNASSASGRTATMKTEAAVGEQKAHLQAAVKSVKASVATKAEAKNAANALLSMQAAAVSSSAQLKRKLFSEEDGTNKKTRETSSPNKSEANAAPIKKQAGRAASLEPIVMEVTDEEVDVTTPLVIDEEAASPALGTTAPVSSTAAVDDAEAMATETEAADQDGSKTEESGWVTRSRRKRQKKKTTTGAPERTEKAEGTWKEIEKRTVYIRGKRGYNLVREVAFKNADAFKTAIADLVGSTEKLMVVGDSIKVICSTEQQAEVLLQTSSLLGRGVTVTVPRRLTGRPGDRQGSDESEKVFRGVIKRVPPFVTTEQVVKDTGAMWAHRIEKVVDGTKRATRAVVVAFKSQLPAVVNVGLNEFKVHVFVPQPLRCAKCQRFGHKAAQCGESAPTCTRCSGSHSVAACTVTEAAGRKCANCGENHSSAYRGCKRYQQVSRTLTVAAKQQMSYADAAKKLAIQQRATKKAADRTVNATSREDSDKAEKSTGHSSTWNIPVVTRMDAAVQTDDCADGSTQTAVVEQPPAMTLNQLSELLQPLVMTIYYLMAMPQLSADRIAEARESALGQLHRVSKALGLDTVIAERRRHSSGPTPPPATHALNSAVVAEVRGAAGVGGRPAAAGVTAARGTSTAAGANDQVLTDETATRGRPGSSGNAIVAGKKSPNREGQRAAAVAAGSVQNRSVR